MRVGFSMGNSFAYTARQPVEQSSFSDMPRFGVTQQNTRLTRFKTRLTQTPNGQTREPVRRVKALAVKLGSLPSVIDIKRKALNTKLLIKWLHLRGREDALDNSLRRGTPLERHMFYLQSLHALPPHRQVATLSSILTEVQEPLVFAGLIPHINRLPEGRDKDRLQGLLRNRLADPRFQSNPTIRMALSDMRFEK